MFQPSIFRCYVSFREGMILSGTLTWLHGISTTEIVAIRHLKINRWRCKLVSFHVPARVLKKRWSKQKLDNETSAITTRTEHGMDSLNVWGTSPKIYTTWVFSTLESTQWRWMDGPWPTKTLRSMGLYLYQPDPDWAFPDVERYCVVCETLGNARSLVVFRSISFQAWGFLSNLFLFFCLGILSVISNQ